VAGYGEGAVPTFVLEICLGRADRRSGPPRRPPEWFVRELEGEGDRENDDGGGGHSRVSARARQTYLSSASPPPAGRHPAVSTNLTNLTGRPDKLARPAIRALTLLAGAWCCLSADIVRASGPEAAGGPGLHFIDVGQGSALLIRGRGEHPPVVLVDAGPSGGAEAVLAALAVHQVSRVALWVLSHYDGDHIGGFGRVLAGADERWPSADDLQIDAVWDRGLDSPVPQTEVFAAYLEFVGSRRTRAEPGSSFDGVDLHLEVVDVGPWPPEVDADEENHHSVVLCLELDGLRVLLPGDLPAARLESAIDACGPVDLLWASHHGAVDGTSVALIQALDPRRVVIGAGRNNTYCHPAPTTLARLADREVWILGAAGLGPGQACRPLGPALSPQHHLVEGDLWISPGPDGGLWLGSPGGGWTYAGPE